MKIADVIVPMLWVGAKHPHWFLSPLLPYVTKLCDRDTGIELGFSRPLIQLLMTLYAPPEPTGKAAYVLSRAKERDMSTWFNHIPYLEEHHGTAN